MASRIYEVQYGDFQADKKRTHLIEATSQAAAWRFVADKYVGKPVVPAGRRLADLITSGLKVEVAKEAE